MEKWPHWSGYIHTSRRRTVDEAGSDPDTQARQLEAAGVDPSRIFRDIGVSGSTGTASWLMATH